MNELIIKAKTSIQESNLQSFVDELKLQLNDAKTELKTEDDFAEAESFVKVLEKAEKAMKAAKQKIFEQGELKKIDQLITDGLAKSSAVRLSLQNQVKAEKQRIKDSLIDAAHSAVKTAKNNSFYPEHISVPVRADFAAQIKGKKTTNSMKDALDRFAGIQLQEVTEQTNAINKRIQTINSLIEGFEGFFDINYLLRIGDHAETFIQSQLKNLKAEQEKKTDPPAESKPVEKNESKPVEKKSKWFINIVFFATESEAKNNARCLADQYGKQNVELETEKTG
jgi:hypothetical protein